MEEADMEGREGRLIEGRLTEQIIGGFYAVYNELGPGFLESVYVNALVIVLGELGLKAAMEVPLIVRFRISVPARNYAVALHELMIDPPLSASIRVDPCQREPTCSRRS